MYGKMRLLDNMIIYSVMQSDRNSSKTDTLHKPTTYESHAKKISDQKINLLDK